MEKPLQSDNAKEFFSSPKIVENYLLLQETGVFSYVESLDSEISIYKNLFSGALDIVNRTTISEIMDATVWQISDYFLPASIVFIWKPLQNRDDITLKCYRNYKIVDFNLPMNNINVFEPYFLKHPEPIRFKTFSAEMGECQAINCLSMADPELIMPILGPSGLYGLVLIGRNIRGDESSQLQLAFINNLMSFVSKAIQNHLHYEHTLRDQKTGLFNNGFFMTRLNEEIIRARRTNSETSIIIMDVDHFKDVNDHYGHIAGDRVLENLAITIKQGVRVGDVPSRFGGEEFTVLLPDTGKKTVFTVAERLRSMIEAMKVTWEPPLPKVTVSLGVFTFDKSTQIFADEVIKRADDALYMSKALGRNRVSVWEESLSKKISELRASQNLSGPA